MKRHKEIKWREIVRRAITDYVEKLDEKSSEMRTKKILEELGDDFRKNLSELSFEKAEKEYKKMRDAEWNGVSTIKQADDASSTKAIKNIERCCAGTI